MTTGFLFLLALSWLARPNIPKSIDVELPEIYKQEIQIKWFPERSEANKVANYRYKNWWWIDMVLTMLMENWAFDIYAVWSLWEKWLCQMLPYKNNLKRLRDPNFYDIDFQAKACLDKRLAVKYKSNIWAGYKIRNRASSKIIYLWK